MSEKSEVWIPIEASSGMFSSEYAVSLETADGKNVSFFVDKALVQESTAGSTLRVTVVDSGPGQHTQRVLLPVETFETSSRWVELEKKINRPGGKTALSNVEILKCFGGPNPEKASFNTSP
jgi:hypothetical protein